MLKLKYKSKYKNIEVNIKLEYKSLGFASGVICDFILVNLWLHSSRHDIIVGNCLIVSKLIQLLAVKARNELFAVVFNAQLILAAQAEYILVKLIHTYVRFCS